MSLHRIDAAGDQNDFAEEDGQRLTAEIRSRDRAARVGLRSSPRSRGSFDLKQAEERPKKTKGAEQQGAMEERFEIEPGQAGKIPCAASDCAAQKSSGAASAPKRIVAAK